jgi:hypothetical protein
VATASILSPEDAPGLRQGFAMGQSDGCRRGGMIDLRFGGLRSG